DQTRGLTLGQIQVEPVQHLMLRRAAAIRLRHGLEAAERLPGSGTHAVSPSEERSTRQLRQLRGNCYLSGVKILQVLAPCRPARKGDIAARLSCFSHVSRAASSNESSASVLDLRFQGPFGPLVVHRANPGTDRGARR